MAEHGDFTSGTDQKTRCLDDKRHMTTNGEICKIFMVEKFRKNLLTDVNLRPISLAKHAEWGMACFRLHL